MKWKWFWIEDNDDYTVTDGIDDYLREKEYVLKSLARGKWAILCGLIATIASYINHETAYIELTESNRNIVLLLNNGSIYVMGIAILLAVVFCGFNLTWEFIVSVVVYPCIVFPLFPIVLIIGLVMIIIELWVIIKVPVLFFFLVMWYEKKKIKSIDENIENVKKQNAQML